jgi:hypothetical protein
MTKVLLFQEILGRLLGMLFQWFDATAYLPDGKLSLTLFNLNKTYWSFEPLVSLIPGINLYWCHRRKCGHDSTRAQTHWL